MKKILLFASGTGSNVENIIQYFKNKPEVIIAGVFTNNPNAKVLDKATSIMSQHLSSTKNSFQKDLFWIK